ncbi:MAG: endopeptidase La [Gemmatimonadales bacterium]|nr:endopeptidase La [Gemmatimonadales bacterium]
MTERMTLPVLPLRDMVLFPEVTAPVSAGRRGTLRAIERALKDEKRLIFTVAQRENTEQVSAGNLYTMGTVAHIGQMQRGLGGVQLVLHGEFRAAMLHCQERDGFLEAVLHEVEDIQPPDPQDSLFQALHKEARARAAELGRKSGLPEEVVQQVLDSVTDPGRFADLVAGYLEVKTPERQQLLETLAVDDRLRRVLVCVQRQIAVTDAQEEIKSQVQEEIGERQKEIYLREQLKAIKRELGDGDEDREIAELREKIGKLQLPEAAQKEVERELGRLERTSKESMEAQVIRTYLEWIAELPWNTRSDDLLDLPRAEQVLEDDHYGLKDVKERVLEFLAVRQLREASRQATPEREAGEDDRQTPGQEDDHLLSKGPILLFIGPPGTGKTSIAKSIARAMGRKYVRISLGGARDEADIRGHRRTYVGAMPGRIIQGMKQAGTKNPVFLLDEVDKLGVSFQGDPAAALLEVLDPAQNDSFTDHYLGVPFDLSEVLFIATANFPQNIPGPLMDRMESVEFNGYTEHEKLAIARQYLIPRQLKENGLDTGKLQIDDAAVRVVIGGYTRESGVRQLERELGRLSRKVARRIAGGSQQLVTIAEADVKRDLGRPKVHPEHAAALDAVGVATGMYYTPTGGDIMFVEASLMPGKDELVLTGHLGEVMKESARAALTYAKTHAEKLGIPPEAIRDRDVHIHVPAGAIPKDGPSAGVTMATALISALTGRAARHDVAMTGEVTLSGRVLPIGGVKEKVRGAARAGILEIVLPRENEPELDDLPDEVRRTLIFHPVDDLEEVLKVALVSREAKVVDDLVGSAGKKR